MSKSKLYFLFLIFIFSIISISSLIADEDINFNLGRSIEDNLISKIDSTSDKINSSSNILNLNQEINEDQMFKLELNSFMKLIETEKTQKRISHTLKTGKPLVN